MFTRSSFSALPEALFAEDVREHEWLVVGFDFLSGRPADLSPGSPELSRFASGIEQSSTLPAGDVRSVRDGWAATDCWERLVAEFPAAIEGWNVAEMSEITQCAPEWLGGNDSHTPTCTAISSASTATAFGSSTGSSQVPQHLGWTPRSSASG